MGELALRPTGTPGGPLGAVGQVLVTGAALSPDGARAVVRTYTDAYVYDVPEGDVLAALAGTPTRVALPPARQGEAVAFGANGRDLVVTSEGLPFDVTAIPALSATSSPAASAATSSAAPVEPAPAGGEAAGEEAAGGEAAADGRSSVAADLAIAGVLSAVLVGVYGLLRRRR